MQLIGLILLIVTSWYILKLSSNFLDEKTKKEINDNFELFKKQFHELKEKFSKENLKLLWRKYKEERSRNIESDNQWIFFYLLKSQEIYLILIYLE